MQTATPSQNSRNLPEFFERGIAQSKEGNFTDAIETFQEILRDTPRQFGAYVNLGVLHMQNGDFGQAEAALVSAINAEPFNFMAYYNMFVLKNAQRTEKFKSPQYILKALSCLYCEVGKRQKDKKLLNKAVIYCEDNSMAYAARAKLSELSGHLNLVHNDYESAVYHQPLVPQFYIAKASFEWHNGKYSQCKATMKQYWIALKTAEGQSTNYLKNIGLTAREWTEAEQENMQQTVKNKLIQFENLLKILNSSNETSQEAQKDQQSHTGKQQRSVEKDFSEKISGIFNDESSKNLTQEIQKLERQIKNEGGNIGEGEVSEQQQQETFLTQDIDGVVNEIEKLKKMDEVSIDRSESQISRNTQKSITEQDLVNCKTLSIAFVSAQSFQDDFTSYSARIIMEYGKKKLYTSFQDTKFWKQVFEVEVEYNDEEVLNVMKVSLELRTKSIWSTKKIVGIGEIDILSNNNKVILSNGSNKSAIVYYKLKLL